MKKHLGYLIAVLCLLSCTQVKADVPINTYNPGTYNTSEELNLRDFKVEKSYVQSLDDVTKDEQIYDATVEENQMREGTVYNPHFMLEKINFEGNTKISDQELQQLALEVLGEDIYFDELLEVCSKVTNLYRSKGYLTSYATVPPQRIVDGVATISIVESKVGAMNIEGEKWTREWYLKHIIMGKAGLREGDVFNAKNLQRAMKEINREDYVQVQTEIERQKDGNEDTTITLNVRDRFPINFDVAYDDYGRSLTGAQRVSILLGMHNLTGLGDKIYAGSIISSGSTGWLAGYSLPVSSYGTRFSFDFNDSHVRMHGPLRAWNVKGNAQSYFFKLTHPLVQTANSDLFLYTGYNLVHANTNGINPFTDVQGDWNKYTLHVWRSGLYGMTDDRYGRWIGNLGVDFGMGGSFTYDRDMYESARGDTTFFKVSAGLTRVQRLFARSLGILRVNGMYSPNDLLPAEQMQIGGPYTLRGYQPATLIGDYGVTATAEYRFPIPFLNRIAPKIDERIRLAVFYDCGWVDTNHNVYEYEQNFLHSVGGGTYITFTDWLTAQIGVGFPIGHKIYANNTARFYFSVNGDLDRIIPLRNPEKL